MRWLDGITDSMDEFEQAPRVGDGQGSLACCSSWGCRVRHDWVTELNLTDPLLNYSFWFDFYSSNCILSKRHSLGATYPNFSFYESTNSFDYHFKISVLFLWNKPLALEKFVLK